MMPLTDFHVTIFEAIPSPIFILDSDLSIIDFNEAAARMADPLVFDTLRLRAGGLLGCVHCACCPTGPACRGCEIRHAVREVIEGRGPCRRTTHIQVRRGGEMLENDFLITAVPFNDGPRRLALMILEDISDVIALYNAERRQSPVEVSGCSA